MAATVPQQNGVPEDLTRRRVTLPELPVEIIAQILHLLDVRHLVLCRQLSKLFRDIVDDTALLQFKILLAVNRCVDNPRFQGPVGEQLHRLRAYHDAWGSLHRPKCVDFPVLKESCAHISGSLLAQMDGECTLVCSQLPSVHRNIPQKEWKFTNFGFFVVEYAVDHAQDLLVLVKETSENNSDWFLELVLLSLSTGEPHPLASKKTIAANIEDRNLEEDRAMDILISDDYIGFMVYEDIATRFTELWVWNWRTGDTALNLYGDLMIGHSSRSFMFIGPGQILLPMLVPEGNSDIDIAKLPVIDVRHADGARHTYEYAYNVFTFAMFELPKQKRGVACARLDLFGKPYSSHTIYDKLDHTNLNVPFYADPKFQLLAFRMWMLKANNRWKYYTMFVSSEALRRLSQPHAADPPKPGKSIVIPWSAWSNDARMVPTIRTMHHAHLSQMRCVSAEPSDNATKREYLSVYDFASSVALQREQNEREAAGESNRPNVTYVLRPTVVDASDVWAEDVVTGLPFRKIVTDIQLGTGAGYQISEDCVVVRHVQPKDRCQVLVI